jgi:hypothetical protein
MMDWRERICRRLLSYDPNIVEVVQFGSSIYAPRYAKDVDLLVITGRAKDYGGYLDAANLEDAPFDVDVLVLEVGEVPRQELLRGVLGAFEVLYGEGRNLMEYVKALGDPTFEEARAALKAAKEYFGLFKAATDPLLRDRHAREAFEALFHAARMASMVLLSTEVSRWGLIKRSLPEPYKGKFNAFIRTLHVKFLYNGRYPKEGIEEEFNRWLEEVGKYIDDLELEVKRGKRV